MYQTIRACVLADDKDVDVDVLALWEGGLAGRMSESEADMAFVKQMYYWCKADTQLMDACFRASELMRPKWDHTRGDKTYGQMTIAKVCESNTDVFGVDYV